MSQLPDVTVTTIPVHAYLLDVREDDEWAAGHAPDAHHVVLSTLPAALEQLPKDMTIACICKAGGRSAQAAEFLAQAGFEALNVSGGMMSWQRAGLEMVSDSGAAPTVV